MNVQGMRVAHASNGSLDANDPKLKSAAHEFEASLMQELLKPLQEDPLFADDKSDGIGGAGYGNDSEGSSGALMSFGSEALAKAISERGGFGIATKILDHFGTVQTKGPAVNI